MKEFFDALNARGIEYRINPNKPSEVMLRCFSGLHEDNDPSLSFNIDKGLFHCFSCGFGGDTTKFVKSLNINFFENPLSKQALKIKRLKEKLIAATNNIIEIRLPEPRAPFEYAFRGIDSDVYESFEAFMTPHDGLEGYICFPIYQRGNLKFIEGRLYDLENTEQAKYMRKPNGVDTSKVLFPLDRVKDYTQIILVEGLFDVLKLHSMGYTNSLCIFGAGNFTAEKAKILDEYNCRQVLLLMDNDKAGAIATRNIKKELDKRTIDVIELKLPEGVDPGDLDPFTARDIIDPYLMENT